LPSIAGSGRVPLNHFTAREYRPWNFSWRSKLMSRTTLCRLSRTAALLTGLALSFAPAVADDKKDKEDEGFTSIFNGKDLTGWKTAVRTDSLASKETDPTKVWLVKDGVLTGGASTYGICYTEKSYKNYVLRFEWRSPRAKDSWGMLLHIQDPTKPLLAPPDIVPQCILASNDGGRWHSMSPLRPCEGRYLFDHFAATKFGKPAGEWNTTEVACRDGEITIRLNGGEVGKGKGALREGPFGFIASGAEIHFRNVKVKELE
jgi:hypothetical protein